MSVALEGFADIINDLDLDLLMDVTARSRYLTDPRNARKVKEYTSKTNINIIHPVRPGKKLLVLDIDYSAVFFDYIRDI